MLKDLRRSLARLVTPTARKSKAASGEKSISNKTILSLVVASYNVELYIDRFFESVFTQTSPIKNFEVIIVDDGSTDGTASIVDAWIRKFPDNIKYFYQANAGVSAARNFGLSKAVGDWVGFPDPDDFLDQKYFSFMLKEVNINFKKKLMIVVSNMIYYYDSDQTYGDTHPLRFRFAKGTVRKLTSSMGEYLCMATNCCWIRRADLIETDLKFKSDVKPSFEDAHLVNRLLILRPGRIVTFLPDATYFYRKRSAQDSLVDKAKTSKSWYIEQFRTGYISLMQFAIDNVGSVPKFIQRTCLYDIFWRFRYLVDHDERVALLSNDEKTEFASVLEEAFALIDAETIQSFNLAGCVEEHKIALLAMYKQARRPITNVYLRNIDSRAGTAQFSYFEGAGIDTNVTPYVNGESVEIFLQSKRYAKFLGSIYYTQKLFWVNIEDGDEISFTANGLPCRVRNGGANLGDVVSWFSLRTAREPKKPSVVDSETVRLREHILASKERFLGCTVLMDRPDKADDNAEHLYRYLLRNGLADDAWFVLEEDSKDWHRLEQEGFQLIPFKSDDHIAAQMNARWLISSHADEFIIWPVPKRDFEDLAKFEYVFLQHGIITHDLSNWLNRKPLRLFITTMPIEYASIAAPDTSYVFNEREVLLSGLPRHDSLIAKASSATADSILIIPTWRKYLTDETNRVTMDRAKIDSFNESEFARNWLELLQSEKLKEISQRHELRLVFVPHPNMAMYLEDMSIPDYIEAIDARAGISYQDLLSKAKLAVTDFSSAATEVAVLQRPLVYFHFDAEQAFGGEHVYQKGYFDFTADGFGPVAITLDEVLKQIDAALCGEEDAKYASRRQNAFPFRDGRCSERVWKALKYAEARRPQQRSSAPLPYVANGRILRMLGNGTLDLTGSP